MPPMIPSLRNSCSPSRGPVSAKLKSATSGEPSIYRHVNRICDERLAERLYDLLGHLLGIAKEHHRVVAIEQLVIDAGVADTAHRALHEQPCSRLLHIQHGHPVDRR